MSKLLEADDSYHLKQALQKHEAWKYEINENNALIEAKGDEDTRVLVTFQESADINISEIPKFWKWTRYVSTNNEGNLTLEYLKQE